MDAQEKQLLQQIDEAKISLVSLEQEAEKFLSGTKVSATRARNHAMDIIKKMKDIRCRIMELKK